MRALSSALRRIRRQIFSVSSVTQLASLLSIAVCAAALPPIGCATSGPAPGGNTAQVVDEDAPAEERWVTRHAWGTAVAPVPADASRPPLVWAGADRLDVPSRGASVVGLVLRAREMPLTSDTPTERSPGIVLVASPATNALRWIRPALDAGFVVLVLGERDASQRSFYEVDDATAAARVLANEADVDVDHLFAFGDGAVVGQLALDPDSPFALAGAVGLTRAASFSALPTTDERLARAFLPHAHEVQGRLTAFLADDTLAARVQARNPHITLVHVDAGLAGETDALTRFLAAAVKLCAPDAATSPVPVALAARPRPSSRSAP